MAIAVLAEGQQTAVVATEHTLATDTSGKTCVLVVDTNNMVNGDVLILRIKTKVRAASTSRLAYEATYSNVQIEKNKYSIPVPANNEIVCTLEQEAGAAGRNFDWQLLSLD